MLLKFAYEDFIANGLAIGNKGGRSTIMEY